MGTDKTAFAKSKGASRTTKAPRFNEMKFVQYELDKEQQASCKAWSVSPADVFDYMEAMVSDGYKFSVKYDDYSDCVACFVTCPNDHTSGNAGLILTGRGSTAWKSVKQALWKHSVALDGQWQGFAERTNSSVIDD